MKQAADDAKANGFCPGFCNGGCKNECVVGRIYCASCQELVKNNGVKVQNSHRKQAERSKGIHITVPFFTQLVTLGHFKIRALLPAQTLTKLNVHNVVGVDTAAWKRSVESKHMYIIGGYYVDSNGICQAFWANRKGSDEKWLTASWNIRINNQPIASGDIYIMLDAFNSFVSGRQIVFSTGNTACDYKRLTSAYKWKSDKVNPFPPEDEWFNIGKELVQHVINHNGAIKSPNWKLPTIHANLYETKDAAGNVIQSVPRLNNYIQVNEDFPDTIRDAIWALNVLNCFKNILQQ
jgi:hypothetical protein